MWAKMASKAPVEQAKAVADPPRTAAEPSQAIPIKTPPKGERKEKSGGKKKGGDKQRPPKNKEQAERQENVVQQASHPEQARVSNTTPRPPRSEFFRGQVQPHIQLGSLPANAVLQPVKSAGLPVNSVWGGGTSSIMKSQPEARQLQEVLASPNQTTRIGLTLNEQATEAAKAQPNANHQSNAKPSAAEAIVTAAVAKAEVTMPTTPPCDDEPHNRRPDLGLPTREASVH